jgi:hypothetical protein
MNFLSLPTQGVLTNNFQEKQLASEETVVLKSGLGVGKEEAIRPA